jgi:hypothetical protein
MYPKYFRLMCAMSAVLLAMLACNINVPGGAATSTPGPTTEIGKDVPTATDTPLATETATLEPALTPTETPTLEPSETSTPEPPLASLVKESNCRVGPGGGYDLVVILKKGDKVSVLGRDLGAGFVFVKPVVNLPEGTEGCWVLLTSLDVDGDVTPLPAFTPAPSPTIAPSFIAAYKGVDTCHSSYIRFTIRNTGGVNFRSGFVIVTNLKTQEVTDEPLDPELENGFALTAGCNFVKDIAILGPGQTGYMQSTVFTEGKPNQQKMRAVFKVCTEQFLKGACVTQVLSFIAK